jgi:hypothetical protein
MTEEEAIAEVVAHINSGRKLVTGRAIGMPVPTKYPWPISGFYWFSDETQEHVWINISAALLRRITHEEFRANSRWAECLLPNADVVCHEIGLD